MASPSGGHRPRKDRYVYRIDTGVVEHLERLNEAFVRAWWHWWFFAQT